MDSLDVSEHKIDGLYCWFEISQLLAGHFSHMAAQVLSFDSINWTLKNKSLLHLFPAWYYSTWCLLHCSEFNIWKLRIWSNLLEKSLMENVFCAVKACLRFSVFSKNHVIAQLCANLALGLASI